MSCSHTPEQDNVSRKAWRQVLLSWLLCQRVQSSQVRAELLHSQRGACCELGRFFSPRCLNLEWDQIRSVEPTNVAWHYWSRTERAGACLSFSIKRSGEAGRGTLFTWLPQMHC